MTAVGLCDSNNLCGALEFSESISKVKTQPIIGTLLSVKYKNIVGKIPLFAKDLQGYKNLIKLSSKSYLDIKDAEALARNKEHDWKISPTITRNRQVKFNNANKCCSYNGYKPNISTSNRGLYCY